MVALPGKTIALGEPPSSSHQVDKVQLADWMTEYEALAGSDGIAYINDSLSALQARTGTTDGEYGLVVTEADEGGVYELVSGTWTKRADIPSMFVESLAADEAKAARDKAKQWAVEPEDSAVETSPDEYSALHHAKKAENSASLAQANANDAKAYASEGDLPSVTTSDDGTWARVLQDGGVKAYLVVGGSWAFQQWLDGPKFDTVADLLADTSSTYGGDGTIVEAGGFRYEQDSTATVGFIENSATTPVKLKVADKIITPFHFNAPETGDAGPALQAFFDACQSTYFEAADISGTFSTAQQLFHGSAGNRPLTKKYNGSMTLEASVDIDEILVLEDCSTLEWDSLTIKGTGSVPYAGRGCLVALRTINSGRQIFRRLNLRNTAFAGLCASGGNNSLSTFGDVKATDCGSGAPGYSLTADWSNPVNSGSQGSTSQKTTIDVDQLPPDFILDGRYGAVGDAPVMVRIGSDLHYIYSVDETASTLTVYPWIKSTATPGELTYVFGGGVYQRGADCNVNQIDSVDAIRCGIALNSSSLYGPKASRIVTQLCGIGISVGRTPSGASLGGSYGNIYFENNSHDIVVVMRTGSNAYNYFGAEYALDLSLIYALGAPRMANDLLSASQEPMRRQIFQSSGRFLQFEKGGRNNTSSSYGLTPDRRDHTAVFSRDTMTIRLKPLDLDLNRLTGVDTVTLVMMGGGARKQPTGTLTIEPPDGWTINGGTSDLVYSSLDYPPIFTMQWRVADLDVHVTQINKGLVIEQSAPASPSGGTTVDAEARTAIDSLITQLQSAKVLS